MCFSYFALPGCKHDSKAIVNVKELSFQQVLACHWCMALFNTCCFAVVSVQRLRWMYMNSS